MSVARGGSVCLIANMLIPDGAALPERFEQGGAVLLRGGAGQAGAGREIGASIDWRTGGSDYIGNMSRKFRMVSEKAQ